MSKKSLAAAVAAALLMIAGVLNQCTDEGPVMGGAPAPAVDAGAQ